jgi:Pyruvate phosphate dikinase, PEP/pyruvate binding domain.
MAVILQQVVGTLHGQRFYPDFSGVVRSHNFYPVAPMTFADGIAAVALGLGRTVVDGGKCINFCPRYPRNLLQFSSVEDILANTQTEFCALELDGVAHGGEPGHLRELRFGLDVAEADGTLDAVGSTYSADNHAVYDGLSRPGSRVVTFAPMLKHGLFPLASILEALVRSGEDALGNPVEIEFAVSLPRGEEPADFGFLQIRPLTLARDHQDLSIGDVDPSQIICQSTKVLGNGRIENLQDIVVVDSQRFERSRSQEVAKGRRPLQCHAQCRESSLLADWSRPLGIERSVARNTGGVGRDFRRARHRGSGLSRFQGHALARQPLLPESDCLSGGIFHGESGCR